MLHEFPCPEIESRWRAFLDRSEVPSHYDTPEYFLEPFWNNRRAFAILALQDEHVTGVATGIHLGNAVSCGLKSRPQIGLASGDLGQNAASTLVEGILSEAGSAKLIDVFSWNWTPVAAFERHGFHKRELEGDIVLDLSHGKDALFGGMTKNARRDVRLAVRSGVEVSEAVTEEQSAEWWDVYCAWQQTKRKQIHAPLTVAQSETVRKLRQNRRQFIARYQGKAIAASVVRFCPHGLIEYSSNCSREEFLHLCPNDLLVWKIIEWACEQGFAKFSLGGAHHFLRKFGGTVVPIYRLSLDRSFFHIHSRREEIDRFVHELSRYLPQSVKTALGRIVPRR